MVAEPGGDPEIVVVDRVPVALVRERVPFAEIAAFFDRAYDLVADELERQMIGRVGPAVAVYRGTPTDSVDVAVGYPVQRPATDAGAVVAGVLPAGRVARVVHTGGYDSLPETYERLQHWVADQGLSLDEVMWESYLTEPTPEADPARMLTEISWLLQG